MQLCLSSCCVVVVVAVVVAGMSQSLPALRLAVCVTWFGICCFSVACRRRVWLAVVSMDWLRASERPCEHASVDFRGAVAVDVVVEACFIVGLCVYLVCLFANVDAKLPTELQGVNLAGVDLSKRDLSRHNLTGANLTGANLTGANLTGAWLLYCMDGIAWMHGATYH